MKEQTLITSNSRLEWQRDVNRHFELGWTVVPRTLTISTTATAISSAYGQRIETDYRPEFAVVLEREISDAE